jgi:hypothetical protein
VRRKRPAITSGGSAVFHDYVEAWRGFGAHFDLTGLQILRDANMGGATAFNEDADVSSVSGVIKHLPSGVAHALFGPFPWAVLGPSNIRLPARVLATVEAPWLYAAVFLGVAGFIARLKWADAAAHFMGVYALFTILALSVSIPNDGLLFRYRLPAVLLLALLAPFGARMLSVHFRFDSAAHERAGAASIVSS